MLLRVRTVLTRVRLIMNKVNASHNVKFHLMQTNFNIILMITSRSHTLPVRFPTYSSSLYKRPISFSLALSIPVTV